MSHTAVPSTGCAGFARGCAPFHVSRSACVKVTVSPYRLCIALVALSGFAAEPSTEALLKGVEARYNKAKTLEVLFNETYTPIGSPARAETGKLLLRKPGRMRWDYTQPKGKLFVSDGKDIWLYTPSDNRVVKRKLRESEDMRAPLAFLLGKLDFSKEFRNIVARPEGADTRITAETKTDNLPYSSVEFLVTRESRIREVKVKGLDNSLLAFVFDQEKVNPPADSNLFKFKAPPGAKVLEEAQ